MNFKILSLVLIFVCMVIKIGVCAMAFKLMRMNPKDDDELLEGLHYSWLIQKTDLTACICFLAAVVCTVIA